MDFLRRTSRGRLTRVLVPLLAAAAIPAAANAEILVNERLPFVATLENPCNAQMVAFDGEFHTTFSVTESGGGGFYLQSSFNTSGVTGTGIVDMKRYRMTETATSSLHTGSDGLPFTQKETFKFHIMGPARADDFYLHTTFKITINNNGIPTAFVDNFHTSCK